MVAAQKDVEKNTSVCVTFSRWTPMLCPGISQLSLPEGVMEEIYLRGAPARKLLQVVFCDFWVQGFKGGNA